MKRHAVSLVYIPMLVGSVAVVLWLALPAAPHEAPKGWAYPPSCCSGLDCRPVPASAIGEDAAGYTIRATGEVIGAADTRIRHSPDGDFHWCSVAGRDDGRTICLFVPPKSF